MVLPHFKREIKNMGYVSGIRWNENLIESSIKDYMILFNIKRMPTAHEIIDSTHKHGLAVAIGRYGGYKYWAEKLGLETKKSDTSFGKKYENILNLMLIAKGYKVEGMVMCHPYDLLINGNIKIDVKASNRFHYNKDKNYYYTFNLEKNNPTCDIYVCYCINDDKLIEKILVIPSKFLKQNQLCIGKKSNYDKYVNRWDYLNIYNNFYEKLT